MATDGVKIIDGDTAHDTYWGIMDLYDNGASAEAIRAKIPFPQADIYDDFDYEIYTTAYALAFWEIGFITEEMIREVKSVIEKGTCVKIWSAEDGEKAGKARQKELNRLWVKINKPNTKIRKRKKYKIIKHFVFEINDILSFRLTDNHFYATVILDIKQYRGECNYHFGKIIYKDVKPPTLQDINKSKILGRKIPSGFGMDMTNILSMGFEEMQQQGGIEAILKKEAERTGSYHLGMSLISIEHKNLVSISEKFIKVGTLPFKQVCKSVGIMSGATTFEHLIWYFKELDKFKSNDHEEAFEIESLLEH